MKKLILISLLFVVVNSNEKQQKQKIFLNNITNQLQKQEYFELLNNDEIIRKKIDNLNRVIETTKKKINLNKEIEKNILVLNTQERLQEVVNIIKKIMKLIKNCEIVDVSHIIYYENLKNKYQNLVDSCYPFL